MSGKEREIFLCKNVNSPELVIPEPSGMMRLRNGPAFLPGGVFQQNFFFTMIIHQAAAWALLIL